MEIMNNKNRRQGFTLLEILVSMSIASIVGILVTQVFFTTTRSNTKTELLKDVKQNGEFALGQIERMIHNAKSVESVCPVSGTTLTSVVITNPNNDTTTIGCIFDAAENVTRIASTSGSGKTEYLTGSNITIGGTSCADADNSLSFFCSANQDEPPSIRIQFYLQKAGMQLDQTEKSTASFQTTVTARN